MGSEDTSQCRLISAVREWVIHMESCFEVSSFVCVGSNSGGRFGFAVFIFLEFGETEGKQKLKAKKVHMNNGACGHNHNTQHLSLPY